MRIFIQICIFFAFSLTTVAQKYYTVPEKLRNIAVSTVYEPAGFSENNFSEDLTDYTLGLNNITSDETIIGYTVFDQQSYALQGNRFWVYDDGSMAAVWTYGMNPDGFPDRGTGYNYFDGSQWMADVNGRLETDRTGWPSYAPWGESGEIVASHNTSTHKIYFQTRNIKGKGNWAPSIYSYSKGPSMLSWPRMITSGINNTSIQLLANSCEAYQGQKSAMVYSRSIDGGITWTDENLTLDGTGADSYSAIGPDEYVWAKPHENTLAFLVASPWHDMFMFKSTDNGDSWAKTVIWEHPYPFFDWNSTVTDTFFCVDNSAAICLDDAGKAHVVFGISRVLHNTAGNSFYLFPYVDGIGYWNEDMPAFSNDPDALAPPSYNDKNSEMILNINYVGWAQDVNQNGILDFTNKILYYREMGLSTMPSLDIDRDGTIYLVFSSTTETYHNYDYNFKHVWARANRNGTWGQFIDLTSGDEHILEECIYPQIGGLTEDYIHLTYNADGTPGTAADGDHNYQKNSIIYSKILKENLLTGIIEPPASSQKEIVSAPYPNPVNYILSFDMNLITNSTLRFRIYDSNGRIVHDSGEKKYTAGNFRVQVPVNGLLTGIYHLIIDVNDFRWTEKFIKI